MKTIFGKLLITTTALMLTYGTAGAATAKKTSKLYAYKGSYTGLLVIGGSTSLAGSTTANFTASKKKDIGTLNLTSPLGGGVAVIETFSFNKNTFTYFLSAGTSGVGAGNVSIGKKAITYSGVVSISGTNYTVSGTARLNKKSLTIIETISSSMSTLTFSYNLKRQGK